MIEVLQSTQRSPAVTSSPIPFKAFGESSRHDAVSSNAGIYLPPPRCVLTPAHLVRAKRPGAVATALLLLLLKPDSRFQKQNYVRPIEMPPYQIVLPQDYSGFRLLCVASHGPRAKGTALAWLGVWNHKSKQ